MVAQTHFTFICAAILSKALVQTDKNLKDWGCSNLFSDQNCKLPVNTLIAFLAKNRHAEVRAWLKSHRTQIHSQADVYFLCARFQPAGISASSQW